jgi:hypothetical protein
VTFSNTRRKRLHRFLFVPLGFESNLSLQEQASLFVKNGLNDTNWTNSYFIQFKHQIENRINGNIISPATLKNYYKAAKLFCVMNDITLNWAKITKGFPRIKYYSEDRAPILVEIKKLALG